LLHLPAVPEHSHLYIQELWKFL